MVTAQADLLPGAGCHGYRLLLPGAGCHAYRLLLPGAGRHGNRTGCSRLFALTTFLCGDLQLDSRPLFLFFLKTLLE